MDEFFLYFWWKAFRSYVLTFQSVKVYSVSLSVLVDDFSFPKAKCDNWKELFLMHLTDKIWLGEETDGTGRRMT